VVEAKFFRPAVAADEAQQTKKLDYAVIAKQGSLGITAICALLVLKIFTKAKKKAAAEASAQAGASALPAGSEATGMLPGTTSAAEPVIVRRQLTEVMRNNPEQTRRLFVNWLQEKA
jgi:hypothetical protein